MKYTKERSHDLFRQDNLFRNPIKWKSLELHLEKFTSISNFYIPRK